MNGTLTKKINEWVVKYDKDGDLKFYPLCDDTKTWIKKNKDKEFLKEGLGVVFDFIVIGERSEINNEFIKNYFAKIKSVEYIW
jgi:hypothetical protein